MEIADWRDDAKREVRMRPEYAIPKGRLDQWIPRQSGYAGPLVLQLQ